MTGSRWNFTLPLLTRELIAQAARRRTYALRVLLGLFAGWLGLTFYEAIQRQFQFGGDPLSIFGRGDEIYDSLIWIQFGVIYLLLPLQSAGLLTEEKERDTLQLLLITTLSPGKIVLQKFLGRLIPILVYLCLSFPVLALAYSLGGVAVPTFWGGGILLLLTAIQATALSVLCSAYCSTTIEALIWYTVGFFLSQLLLPWMWGGRWLATLEQGWSQLIPSVLWCAVLTTGGLSFATAVLERRAALSPRNPLLIAFQKLDRFFNSWNHLTGDRVLVRDGEPLPVSRPVAWRETAKKSLGTFRYLFRVLLLLQSPLIVVLAMLSDGPRQNDNVAIIDWYLNGVLLIMTGMLVIHASGLISGERGRQTLQVLLSSPLTGQELIHQKQAGVLRLSRVMLVPILTILAFQAWWYRGDTYLWPALTLTLATTLVLQRVVTWTTIWIGLRVSSQARALIFAVSAVVAWWAVGQYGIYLALRLLETPLSNQLAETWVQMHPLTTLAECQRLVRERVNPLQVGARVRQPAWVLHGVGLVLHLLFYLAIKRRCLSQSDRWLGRLSELPETASADTNRDASAPAPPGATGVE